MFDLIDPDPGATEQVAVVLEGELPNDCIKFTAAVPKISYFCKGERILLSQDFEEVVIIPSSSQAFGLDDSLDRMLMLEQVEGNMAQDGKVFGAMIFS